MAVTTVEYVFFGMWVLQILSAAVSAMPRPTKPGWYSWFYGFSHILTNNLDAYFERRFGVHMPRATEDEAAFKASPPATDAEDHTANPTQEK